MDESEVKEIFRKWLINLPNVNQISPETNLVPGGLIADFITKQSNGQVLHIVECKGSVDIGELAKGIGQCYQYLYQSQMSNKSKNAEIIFVCPEDRDNALKVMKIPANIKVVYISSRREIYERIQTKPTGKYSLELQIPGTFYIRDIMFNDYVKIFKKIDSLCHMKKGLISKEDIIEDMVETQATAYRNFLITFRTLGFIDNNYRFTPDGYRLLGILNKSKKDFFIELTKIYYPFFINILNALIHIAIKNGDSPNNIKCTHKNIADAFREIWGNDVRFLKDHQTISTIIRNLEELNVVKKIGHGGAYKINGLIHPDYLPWLIGRIDKF